MRHGVRAEEGLWLPAGSHLSKTTKGGAPQATEIKSYDNVGHPRRVGFQRSFWALVQFDAAEELLRTGDTDLLSRFARPSQDRRVARAAAFYIQENWRTSC
jgi:hypothetical protein